MASSNSNIPGLNLGASGLATKVVLFQIINVNLLNYFISSKMGWEFRWLFQFNILIICLLCGWLSWVLSKAFTEDVLLSFLINFIFYSIFTLLSILTFPSVLGLTRRQLFDRSTYLT